jgi:molecular chaperone DnaK
MEPILGIDLGTTNSAMAYVNEYGRPEVIINSQGGRITPSVVFFDDPEIVVGDDAVNNLPVRPLDVVREVKRHMGSQWIHTTPEGKQFSPEEISGFILTRLKQDASQQLGEPVSKAVVTVPAYFDDARRKATQDAGRIAGLDVISIINEPTAAAIAYGLDKNQNGTILVFDLGGGTFDATVMRVKDQHLEVLFSGGDANLGGLDWDNALMAFANTELVGQGGIDSINNPSLLEKLREGVRQTKHTLTNVESSTIRSPSGVQKVKVTRADFERITEHLLDRALMKTEEVLDKAGTKWADLTKVLLVGGATRMPAVRSTLKDRWGREPSIDLNPDESVAMGAALFGALSANAGAEVRTEGGTKLSAPLIEDVTTHSLGVEIVADRRTGRMKNSIVLPAGSKIPARNSSVFYTVSDRQTHFECIVYQGEEEDIEWVKEVGKATIQLPGTYPAEAPMEITFEYDSEGLIHVSVTDRVANLPLGELHLERLNNRSAVEVDSMVREAAEIEVTG